VDFGNRGNRANDFNDYLRRRKVRGSASFLKVSHAEGKVEGKRLQNSSPQESEGGAGKLEKGNCAVGGYEAKGRLNL